MLQWVTEHATEKELSGTHPLVAVLLPPGQTSQLVPQRRLLGLLIRKWGEEPRSRARQITTVPMELPNEPTIFKQLYRAH